MCHLLFTLLRFLSMGPKAPHSTIQLQPSTSHNIIFTHLTHCSPSVSPSMPLPVRFSDFSSLRHPPFLWSLAFVFFRQMSRLSSAASYLDVHHILWCSIPKANGKISTETLEYTRWPCQPHLACMVNVHLHFATACFNIYSSQSPSQQTGTCPCSIFFSNNMFPHFLSFLFILSPTPFFLLSCLPHASFTLSRSCKTLVLHDYGSDNTRMPTHGYRTETLCPCM